VVALGGSGGLGAGKNYYGDDDDYKAEGGKERKKEKNSMN
jgi:hypothetical protein